MITYIRDTIRGFVAPEYQIATSKKLWKHVQAELARRGGGVRESGGFLLGRFDRMGRRVIERFVPYDEVDPHSLDTGIIDFDGTCFEALFDLCRATGLRVVADVHTHPAEPYQSASDQANPMIAREGHIALIIPDFAQKLPAITDIGIYRYLGNRRWENWNGKNAARRFHIGF